MISLRLSIVALVIAVGVPGASLANPPAIGHWVGDKPITLCDTKEQVDMLIAAGKEKGNGFAIAYGIFYSKVNELGERTCVVLPPGTGNVTALGEPEVMWFGDVQANVITAELTGNQGRKYWLLYNTGNITQPSSTPPALRFDAPGRNARYIILEPPWSIRSLLGV